ncbi:MAG: hypothetical protein R3C56_43090, partial [Pirellulaceae bacterium]
AQFPSLRMARGVQPWSPNQLDIWASEILRSENEIHSARFLLSLWNDDCEWECGIWNCQLAIRGWDYVHRSAFLQLATQHVATC